MGRVRYPADLTEEEAEFGFTVRESSTGVFAVVRDLGGDLQAVKVYGPNGKIEYAICDRLCNQLYRPAVSVDELRTRFTRR